MSASSKKAAETNALYATSEPTSSTNNNIQEGGKGGEFLIEEPKKKYNNSKNLPNGIQLIQIINKRCKNIKP